MLLPRRFSKGIGVWSMNRLLVKLAITALAGSLLFSNPIVAQILPPQKRAEHVEITKGPELEIAYDDTVIVRWTTTNPRGDDEHYGVVHYGTDPEDLSQTAKGHIRLNRAHPETMFRVRMVGLKPQTIYYYKVSLMGPMVRAMGWRALSTTSPHRRPASGS